MPILTLTSTSLLRFVQNQKFKHDGRLDVLVIPDRDFYDIELFVHSVTMDFQTSARGGIVILGVEIVPASCPVVLVTLDETPFVEAKKEPVQ